MKCIKCAYEAPLPSFRYLYNARIDTSITVRQCPKCGAQMSVNELKGQSGKEITPGTAPWGKSAGIERASGLSKEDMDQQEIEAS